jgi:predicted nucleic acid-binding protein
VWISRYVPVDAHHVASRAWLFQHLNAGNRIVAPTMLLPEVAGAIARRTGNTPASQQISLQLRRLPGLYWVGLTGDLAERAADLAATFRLRGADSIYVALADRLRIPLITWDGEQLTRPQPPIIAQTP